jgi:hypothetical protein
MRGAIDRNRLVKLLGMMGSSHDGEALAAARLAERLRAAAGMTWAEIVKSKSSSLRSRSSLDWPKSTAQAIEFCIERVALLSTWDRNFLKSIARRSPRHLSEKQLGVLARMVRTVMAGRVA